MTPELSPHLLLCVLYKRLHRILLVSIILSLFFQHCWSRISLHFICYISCLLPPKLLTWLSTTYPEIHILQLVSFSVQPWTTQSVYRLDSIHSQVVRQKKQIELGVLPLLCVYVIQPPGVNSCPGFNIFLISETMTIRLMANMGFQPPVSPAQEIEFAVFLLQGNIQCSCLIYTATQTSPSSLSLQQGNTISLSIVELCCLIDV